MGPQNNPVGAVEARISSPPRPIAPPATEVAGQAVPRIDEHGRMHGVLSGGGAPARGWAGLPPGYFDGQPGPSGVVPPWSPAMVMRVLGEDSSGAPFSFVETDEDLVQLAIEKSRCGERRQAKRRRCYQQHVEAFNARQLERGLRADEEVQAKKREWDAIAASQFDNVGCSSTDSSDD